MRIGFLLSILALIGSVAFSSPVDAYRDYLTVEQKAQLEKIQTVLVEAIALTDKGTVDAGPLADVASRRLAELGYTVVRDAAKPHDATFKLKCEQRKTWEGTTAAGGDADLPTLLLVSGKGRRASSRISSARQGSSGKRRYAPISKMQPRQHCPPMPGIPARMPWPNCGRSLSSMISPSCWPLNGGIPIDC